MKKVSLLITLITLMMIWPGIKGDYHYHGNSLAIVPYFTKFFEIAEIQRIYQLQNFYIKSANNTFYIQGINGNINFLAGRNSPISLKPVFNLDMTIKNSNNCTSCLSRKYKSKTFNKTGFVYRAKELELSIKDTNYSFKVNGSSVIDEVCANDLTSKFLANC